MAFYQFKCSECPGAPKSEHGDYHLDAIHERQIPITKAPPVGKRVICPSCKRRTAKRILSTGIGFIIKGNEKALHDLGHGTTMMTRMNGMDVPLTFMDHKHTDPTVQAQMNAIAKRAGIGDGTPNALRHAYRNKDGRLVVDVASSVPDPLGALQRAKKRGDVSVTKKDVKQPYRVRNPKVKKL